MTIPTAVPLSSTSTTEPTLRSRMISATRRTAVWAPAVTTVSVITSRSCMAADAIRDWQR